MKKLIPLILYPYAYIILMILYIPMAYAAGLQNPDKNGLFFAIIMLVAAIYNIYVIVISIYNAVITSKLQFSVTDAAKRNLIIKGCQIPAYIFHFILAFLGLLMSVFGIGLIMWAFIIDVLTIYFSGISSIGCAVRLCKEKQISKFAAVFLIIGSFIFCVDIVVAIVYMVKSRKNISAN